MRDKVSIIVVFSLMLVSGCTTRYAAPANGPTATIDFENEALEKMSVEFYDGAKECTNRKVGGFIKPKSKRSFVIPANKDVVYTVSIGDGPAGLLLVGGGLLGAQYMDATYSGCNPTIDFIPQDRGRYAFIMKSHKQGCQYVFEMKSPLDEKGKKVQLETFSVREWIRPFGEEGPFCKEKKP